MGVVHPKLGKSWARILLLKIAEVFNKSCELGFFDL